MEYCIAIVIFLIVHPYITYPLFLYVAAKLRATELPLKEGHTVFEPAVTVLIAAYNEEGVIADKILNTLHLRYPAEKLQIVVGSDGSTDRTNRIVREYAQKYNNILLLDYPQRRGKVSVINDSFPYCRGEIVVLSDANALYNEEAIRYLLTHFRNSNVGCVAGEKRMAVGNAADYIGENEGLYWKLESYIKAAESRLDTVIGADGALYAIRKQLFQNLPAGTSVDDFLLSMLIVKKGYKIAYEPNAYSYEHSGQTLAVEFARKVRIAAGNFYNLKYMHSFFRMNLQSFLFISHKVLRWISPFLFLLLTGLLLAAFQRAWIYRFVFFIMMSCYLTAFFGYRYERSKFTKNKAVTIVTHFFLTVVAQFCGFIRYVKRSQTAFWDTARQ